MQKTASNRPTVSSPDNEVVRRLRRLASRRRPGEILLEGPRVVAEAVAAGLEIEVLALRAGEEFECRANRTVVLSDELFRSLSQTVTPQGVLAVAHRELGSLEEALARAADMGWPVIVLDGVQDPGNVGAICRIAAAAGAPAIALLPGTADPYGPKAVRASAGTVFRLLLARADWPQLGSLDAWGAAARGGLDLGLAPIEAGRLLVLGSEAHGLSSTRLRQVTVSLEPGIESLNVAAAAAILLFEIRRRKVA